ncbi:hypothetical protein CK203_099996 [Vitis vinifera]|uniref:Uncharacterized protein n=1 Tax=Vitis vinifera TaxID=29760 RepID=A0A438DI66_VITVI|nr:hypothetical protein CK203_099996 [Vitis vinifera]
MIERREKTKEPFGRLPDRNAAAASPPKKLQRKKRKLVKNGKGVKEPTPPKEFFLPPITHEAEVIIEEPVNPAPHSILSEPGHVAGLNHSSTSLVVVVRLANLAEEAASINHPGSLNPDVDAAEAICATPMEESGAKSQSQSSDDPDRLALVLVRPRSARNLRSGLIGWLQDHLHLSRKDNENQLRLRLEEAEASLSTVRKDNEALRADLAEAKSREESMEARLHEAEDEMTRLRGEVRQLRTEASIEKKQKEDLQLRLTAQKEELEREFAAEREEL